MKRAAFFLVLLLAAGAKAEDVTSNPQYVYPLIEKTGGVVAIPGAAEPPRRNSKIVVDLTSGVRSGDVLNGLVGIARMANMYTLAGAGPDQGLQLTVIIHGKATSCVLTDGAYRKYVGGNKNPDLALVKALKAAGIELYVCGQALAHENYPLNAVAPSVTVALSAAAVNVNRQMDGFTYLPIH